MKKLLPVSYRHVDVFSNIPLSGNGLVVFSNCDDLSTESMQKITEEMRQFESIFLFPTSDPFRFKARIFTVEEELDFAGHPILGAAAVLHEKVKSEEQNGQWTLDLRAKSVTTKTQKRGSSYFSTMDQGKPHFETPLDKNLNSEFLKCFNLGENDLHESLPLQVVSTGLPYLIIPVRCNLDRVRITVGNLEQKLAEINAKFAYVLQVADMEGRTWDNQGKVEDVATGSAAGPVGAYLIKQGAIKANKEIILNQGKFVGRPSQIFVKAAGNANDITSIEVSGDVCMVAKGTLDI